MSIPEDDPIQPKRCPRCAKPDAVTPAPTTADGSRGPTYTADQLYQGVLNAIAAKDLQAAVDILEALAVVDFDRAAAMHADLKDSLVVARFLRGGS